MLICTLAKLIKCKLHARIPACSTQYMQARILRFIHAYLLRMHSEVRRYHAWFPIYGTENAYGPECMNI
jgi:hypothetical protein